MTTYKVTGTTAYAGHQPGEEFDAELDEQAERRAVGRGSIRVVKRADKKTTKKEEEEATDA
jgi:hypothetical protein